MRDVRSSLPHISLYRATSPSVSDVTRDVIPVTRPARTLLDLAGVLGPQHLELALDCALRRRLITVSRMRWQLNHFGTRGRPGAGVLRAMLDARPSPQAVPESAVETRLFRLISTAVLPLPVPQHVIKGERGFVARVDFVYPAQKLAIEADGYRYHSGRQVWERDLARNNELSGLGWMILHFTHHQVVNCGDEVVTAIAKALLRRNSGAKRS